VATRLMLDEIRRLPAPVPQPRRERAWRGGPPLLAAPADLDYHGVIIHRLAAHRYQATIGPLVWILDRARFEIRTTGRRIRQRARYLIGYLRGVRAAVFLEFVPAPPGWDDAMLGLSLELNRLADKLTTTFIGHVFALLHHKAARVLP
jgi:hypothetical protein